VVSLGEAIAKPLLMLIQTPLQIIGHASVESRPLVAKNVNEESPLAHLSLLRRLIPVSRWSPE
jgi:hypothetical protein